MKIFVALLTKNQQEIGYNLLIKIFVVLLIKKKKNRVWFTKGICGSVDKKSTRNWVLFMNTDNCCSIGFDLLMKVFVALLMKNQQEIGSNLLIKIFMSLLMKNLQEIGSN